MMRLILVLTLLLVSGMSSAEVYKWVDANGGVHYQDHPRGAPEKFSTVENSHQGAQATHTVKQSPKTQKLLKAMEKSRKQQEKLMHKKLAEERKQDEKCQKQRDKARALEARMKKHYSEFSNDRPASYQRQAAGLADIKKYLDKYCN